MIYKFRAILDAEEDIFRDIAIDEKDTLEDLHNALVNAFGFYGDQMAAFYTCDDNWNQEDEIPLFDTGDVPGEIRTMKDFVINDLLYEQQTKIIYVYDFFSMWTFFVELAGMEDKQDGESYPLLLFSHGIMPEEATEQFFEGEDLINEFEDDYDDEDFDNFDDEDFNDFNEFDTNDDNWN